MTPIQFTASEKYLQILYQGSLEPILAKFGPNRRHHQLEQVLDDAVDHDPGVCANSPHLHFHPRGRISKS